MSLARSLFILIALATKLSVQAQTADDTIRVTIAGNADGSRTTYEFDDAKHQAIATTADPGGKLRSKVVYRLDDSGRFVSGVVYGPDDKFLFKTVYKYDAADDWSRRLVSTRVTRLSKRPSINMMRPGSSSARRHSTRREN